MGQVFFVCLHDDVVQTELPGSISTFIHLRPQSYLWYLIYRINAIFKKSCNTQENVIWQKPFQEKKTQHDTTGSKKSNIVPLYSFYLYLDASR